MNVKHKEPMNATIKAKAYGDFVPFCMIAIVTIVPSDIPSNALPAIMLQIKPMNLSLFSSMFLL